MRAIAAALFLLLLSATTAADVTYHIPYTFYGSTEECKGKAAAVFKDFGWEEKLEKIENLVWVKANGETAIFRCSGADKARNNVVIQVTAETEERVKQLLTLLWLKFLGKPPSNDTTTGSKQ